MNYLKPILLIGLYLLFSCENEMQSGNEPSDLLTEQQMTGVLIDIHIAESALSMKNYNRDTSLALFKIYENQIFEQRKITEKQFKESYEYYARHSTKLDNIYAAVVDSIAVKESNAKLK